MMIHRPYLDTVDAIVGSHHVFPDLNDFSSRPEADHPTVCKLWVLRSAQKERSMKTGQSGVCAKMGHLSLPGKEYELLICSTLYSDRWVEIGREVADQLLIFALNFSYESIELRIELQNKFERQLFDSSTTAVPCSVNDFPEHN